MIRVLPRNHMTRITNQGRKVILMSLKPLKYLKRELVTRKNYQVSRNPQANNPTYLEPRKFGCPYCKVKGNGGGKWNRHFKNLWCLYMHFREHHKDEPTFKDLTRNIADMIISGVWV